ncbi:MAG: hypothetical protein COV44_07465 [Deltaproteobacteria bacterium CG11_big_fil_rev_8_21_14_0_20_45_16]|nr:MAG: hypothetical protein COV44_07465 [Deltaproteobacteria bacterium CG11_big_fil_rev_8_21_14_0_20_45_16]
MRGLAFVLAYIIGGLYMENVLAHAGGHQSYSSVPLTEKQLGQRGKVLVGQLVTAKRMDASWSKVDPLEVKSQGQEWVVSFKNPKEKDETKRMLYIFMTIFGDALAANHTGK